MATATMTYTASNTQGATWRRQSLREAYAAQAAGTAREISEHGSLHLFAVPSESRMAYRFVVWNCQDDEFFCSTHRMHACPCSGAALVSLMQRGLLAYMTSDTPAETEANALVWRAANR